MFSLYLNMEDDVLIGDDVVLWGKTQGRLRYFGKTTELELGSEFWFYNGWRCGFTLTAGTAKYNFQKFFIDSVCQSWSS